MLAVYEDDGEFTVRTSDSALAKSVTPQVIKAIGESVKARKLILITPTDTKVFKFGGSGHAAGTASTAATPAGPSQPETRPSLPPKARERILQDSSAPPAPEILEEEYVDAANQAAL